MGPMSHIFGPSPLGRSVPSEDGKYCCKFRLGRRWSGGHITHRAYRFHLCPPHWGGVCLVKAVNFV